MYRLSPEMQWVCEVNGLQPGGIRCLLLTDSHGIIHLLSVVLTDDVAVPSSPRPIVNTEHSEHWLGRDDSDN